MYQQQVERLSKELAALEGKRAEALRRAAKDQGDAARVSSSISSSTSKSSTNQKLRDSARKQQSAADHEARAAKYSDQIANKRRSLRTAQSNLDRALDQKRRKDDRDTQKRRAKDREHLREIERARHAAQGIPRLATLGTGQPSMTQRRGARETSEYEYDICLSFAGEDRAYVEMVADALSAAGVRVFYDQAHPAELWGKDLLEYLDFIYRKASRYCVMFISEAYARKPWTVHERRSALARAMNEDAEYVLPARFDDTELPGLRPTVGYVDLRENAPMSLADLILTKLGREPQKATPADSEKD